VAQRVEFVARSKSIAFGAKRTLTGRKKRAASVEIDPKRTCRLALRNSSSHNSSLGFPRGSVAKPRTMESKMLTWLHTDQREVFNSIRTAVAAVGSLLIARFCRLPESYWAAITAIVVMQSTLGASWTISKQRFAGTALGAAMGALLATYAVQNVAAFGAGVFVLGLICALLCIGRNAFRYAGITLAIVMLIARTEPAWMTAIHRFLEISLGIGVGLLVIAVWPEPEPATT
jgi:uncharacterized membrane protein YccC